jgi:hypothetical protein
MIDKTIITSEKSILWPKIIRPLKLSPSSTQIDFVVESKGAIQSSFRLILKEKAEPKTHVILAKVTCDKATKSTQNLVNAVFSILLWTLFEYGNVFIPSQTVSILTVRQWATVTRRLSKLGHGIKAISLVNWDQTWLVKGTSNELKALCQEFSKCSSPMKNVGFAVIGHKASTPFRNQAAVTFKILQNEALLELKTCIVVLLYCLQKRLGLKTKTPKINKLASIAAPEFFSMEKERFLAAVIDGVPGLFMAGIPSQNLNNYGPAFRLIRARGHKTPMETVYVEAFSLAQDSLRNWNKLCKRITGFWMADLFNESDPTRKEFLFLLNFDSNHFNTMGRDPKVKR